MIGFESSWLGCEPTALLDAVSITDHLCPVRLNSSVHVNGSLSKRRCLFVWPQLSWGLRWVLLRLKPAIPKYRRWYYLGTYFTTATKLDRNDRYCFPKVSIFDLDLKYRNVSSRHCYLWLIMLTSLRPRCKGEQSMLHENLQRELCPILMIKTNFNGSSSFWLPQLLCYSMNCALFES